MNLSRPLINGSLRWFIRWLQYNRMRKIHGGSFLCQSVKLFEPERELNNDLHLRWSGHLADCHNGDELNEIAWCKSKGSITRPNPIVDEQVKPYKSISKVYVASLNSHYRPWNFTPRCWKKTELKTPHFLSLNQDLVYCVQEKKWGLNYVIWSLTRKVFL